MRLCTPGAARAAAGVIAAALLGACGGTSGIVKAPFTQGVIGPGGGFMATAHVELTVYPGAFDQDRVLAILPQPTPLPVDPSAGSMTYLPGIMCIGPIGLPLLVDCRLSFCYDASAIPVGSTEADLVLLEWDEDAGFMRPKDRFTPGVTQDTVSHCFVDVAYTELGHVGVAVRSGPQFNLVVPAGPPLQTDVLPQGDVDNRGLLLANIDGSHAPAPLPNTRNAFRVIPSHDGTRVLYSFSNFQTESNDLRVSDVADGTQRIVGFDEDASNRLDDDDPTYGWIGATDVVHWVSEFDDGDSDVVASLWTTGGSGTPPAAFLNDGPDDMYVSDLRTSPDGTMILVRFTNIFNDGEQLEVFDAVTGDRISEDVPLYLGSDSPTPRWLPDNSGLYGVGASGTLVERVDPDGDNLATLYAIAPPQFPVSSSLVDFVVAPSFTAGTASTTRCAYVRLNAIFLPLEIAGPIAVESFVVDVIGGGQILQSDFEAVYRVREMCYQPDGARVWLALEDQQRGLVSSQSVPPVPTYQSTLAFSATDASHLRTLPFPISDMDLDRSTQRVVVYQRSFTKDPDFPNPGLYLLSPDLQTQSEVTFTGFQVQDAARFLRSWRLTPGSQDPGRVR
jgi:hypothetical protein